MTVTIYHNPRCSKSRQTLELIREKGIEPDIVLYLKNAPSAEEIRGLLARLDKRPRDIMRKSEAAYKQLGLSDQSLSEDALIAAMTENPVLIERPIVVAGDKARLGRPPEDVLEII